MYDPSTSYAAPIQGYSWAGQPPQSLNPFAAAGTSMIQDYAVMKQQRELEQYQQLIQQPAMMSPAMQARIAYGQEYNYGMVGGQSSIYESVQRNSLIGGSSMAMMGATAAMTWPFFTMASKATTPLLTAMAPQFMGTAAGRAAGFVVGGAAGMGVTAPIYAIAQRGIDRARYASDIEGDITDYSSRWTAGTGFGRSATRSLSYEMMRDMNAPGQFLRAEDQLKIHKMGLSSGILKGRDASEYKRNFDELKKNAQDIIQMLNTTVEGGMSVMKELSNAGFRSPTAMRMQVSQAAGMGNVSGIGAQNMLALGAQGAMAARGTGWSPGAMSNAYQSNAVTISQMALNNPLVNNAMISMGGVANAAAAMANVQANVFRSGMGIQSMAAIMDPRTRGIMASAFEKFAGGEMGALGVTGRAGAFGMNTHSRVLFEKYAVQNMNKMTEEQKAHFYRGIYKTYASTRGGMSEAAAWEFAGQFTRNFDERVMFSEMVGSPVNFAPQRSAMAMQEYQNRTAGIQPYSPLSKFFRGIGYGASNMLNAAGDAAYSITSGVVGAVGGKLNSLLGTAFGPAGIGIVDTYKAPPSEVLARRLYGYNRVSDEELNILRSYGSTIKKYDAIDPSKNSDYRNAINNVRSSLLSASATTRQQFFDMLAGSVASGSNLGNSLWVAGNLGLDKNTMNMLRSDDVRRSMMMQLNVEQKSKNSIIESAQLTRNSLSNAEQYNLNSAIGTAFDMRARGASPTTIQTRLSAYSPTVSVLAEQKVGLSSIVALSDARISQSQRDSASSTLMEKVYATEGQIKKGYVRGSSSIFSSMVNETMAAQMVTRWNAPGANRSQLWGEYAGRGWISSGFTSDDAGNIFTSQKIRSASTSLLQFTAQEAKDKMIANIKGASGGAADDVVKAVYNLATGAKGDVNSWLKQARTISDLKDSNISQVKDWALGKAGILASNNELEKIRSDQINSLEEKIKKASKDAGGKPTEELRKLLIDLNQLKNQSQGVAGIVNDQQQQSSAPNILNYWNCKWMVG